MKIATLISSIISTLLMLSTMICGLWIRANNITAESSFKFHENIGIAAVVFSLLTLVLFIIMLSRMKKKG